MNDQLDPNLESNQPDETASVESQLPEDDLRYAPPVAAVEAPVESVLDSEVEAEIENETSVTDGLDIEAALAAVSSLSDMVAEQEAAEQARIAKEEVEAQLRAERQARLDHPERFFPVPPMTTLHRGQLASLVPAVFLILVGVWLTFSLTTTKTLPDTGLLVLVIAGGFTLTFLFRWLSSGRWARGSLFFALALLLCGIVAAFLLQSTTPGIAGGWPLLIVALGTAIILTALFSQPVERRLILPGILLIAAGIAGLVISLNLLSGDFVATAASLWPVAIVIMAVIWLLPVIFRQRQ